MNFLKNTALLFLMITIDQSIHASHLIYKKNIAHNNPQAAQRLTEESFITPEMQWSILSCLGADQMVINPQTGQVQGLPTVENALMQINQKLSQPMYHAQKESLKQAAHALLEASDIALFVTSIEAVYQPYNAQSTNQLIAQLTAQKQAINSTLTVINNVKTLDPAPSSSYFSWIPYFGSGNNQQIAQLSSQQIQFNPSSQLVAIPASLMPTIIKINDYKEMSSDPVQAANLLFKECFIAQQHHLKDNVRIESLKINLQSPISAQNYIFTQFPNLYNNYSGSYPICQIAQKLVASQAPRYDLQAPLKPEHQQAHELLLHIRQAIQTALYIANKKSNYNAGSMLSSSITSWLDGIVSQLTKHDAYLAQLCKDPLYGATQADIDREAGWSATAKIAGGLLVVGTALALDHMYGFGIGSAVYGTVSGGTSTAAGYAKSAASNLVPSAVSNLWSSKPATNNAPVEGPQLLPTQKLDNINAQIFENNQKLQKLESEKASANTARAASLDREITEFKQNNMSPLLTERTQIQNQIRNQNNATAPGTDAQDKTPTWTDRAGQAWGTATDLSGYAMTVGGGIATASQIAKHVAPEQYKQLDKNYLGGNANKIEFAAGSLAAAGGGIAGINQIGQSYSTWKKPVSLDTKTGLVNPRGYLGFLADSWSLFSTTATTILFGLPRSAAAAAGLATLAANEFGQYAPQFKPTPVQQGQQYQTQNQAPAQIQQMNREQLYQGLIAMAQHAPEKNMDPFQAIAAGLQYVSENNMANPQTMYEVLQKMRDEAAANNPELAQNLNTIVQAFEEDLQNAQNQQPAPAA
jgi:hypothetical protein